MRTLLLTFLALNWQIVYADTSLSEAHDSGGRVCIASVATPNDKAKSLSNPGGGIPDVEYSVKIGDHSPLIVSRDSGAWLDGLMVDKELPVLIFENGERKASFFMTFSNDDSTKCLFMNTLYRTWQVWSWSKVGAWCDCELTGNE